MTEPNQPEQEPEAQPGGEPAPRTEYILVALDASPHARAALTAAAELAATLHLELRGLYVEDVNLIHLSGLPFSVEVGTYTARTRRLEQSYIEREFRLQAARLHKLMADVAGQRRVQWSFQVVRGGVTDQLLAASASARLWTLGRIGRSPGKRIGSTAQAIALRTQRPVVIQSVVSQSVQQRVSGPFTVAYTGTPAAENALALGVQMAAQEGSALTVLVFADLALEPLALQVQAAGVDVILQHAAMGRDLLAAQRDTGAVILPIDVAPWVEAIAATVIVVP